METTPAVDRFDARTAELRPDVRDGAAHTITDIRSGEGPTARFQPLFDETPVGARRAEDGETDGLLRAGHDERRERE
nr:MAG TPA: hypothetical protein [Caudoviricetes sp.]